MTYRVCIALVLAGCLLSGCGGDGGSDETGTEVAAADNVADVGGTDNGAPDEAAPDLVGGVCPGLKTIQGQAFRVTEMEATEPTDQVNEVWALDIAAYSLVMVFHVVEYNEADGTAKIEVTSCSSETTKEGDKVTPVGYQFALKPAPFNVKFDGCSFTIVGNLSMDVMTPSVSKPFHIFGLTGGGSFNESCTKILKVDLAGFIKESEAFDLCLMIPGLGSPSFHWFMNLAHICADADSDGDGTIDSYRFVGHVAATRETELFKEGIKAIESTVEECLPDDKKCVSL